MAETVKETKKTVAQLHAERMGLTKHLEDEYDTDKGCWKNEVETGKWGNAKKDEPINKSVKVSFSEKPEILPAPAELAEKMDKDENTPKEIEELLDHPKLSKITKNKLIKHLELVELEYEQELPYLKVLVGQLLKKKSFNSAVLVAMKAIKE